MKALAACAGAAHWRLGALSLAAAFGLGGCLPEDQTGRDAEGGESAGTEPTIEKIVGNSALEPGEIPQSFFRDGVMLLGRDLTGIMYVHLVGIGGAPNYAELSFKEYLGERVDVDLPRQLVEGTYRVRVGSTGGEATAEVVVKRGAQGPPGTLPPSNTYTLDELEAKLPAVDTLVPKDQVGTVYAIPSDLVPLETFAEVSALGEYLSTESAEQEYALLADLPSEAQQGFPTESEVLATFAKPEDLPDDIAGAIKKSELPDWSAYVLVAEAAAEGVPKGWIEVNLYPKAELDETYVSDLTGLGPSLEAALDQLFADAVGAAPPKSCPADMAKVGMSCIDRFEARARVGSCDSASPLLGQSEMDFTPYLPTDGVLPSGAPLVLACSSAQGKPAAWVNWFQAATMCQAAGKRLCSNAEWQAAAAGTAAGVSDGCVFEAGGPSDAQTGCASAYGAQHLAGNLAEWTATWFPGGVGHEKAIGTPISPRLWPLGDPNDGGAYYWNSSGRTHPGSAWADELPTVLVRGGHFASGAAGGSFAIDATLLPFAATKEVGFRCCRNL